MASPIRKAALVVVALIALAAAAGAALFVVRARHLNGLEAAWSVATTEPKDDAGRVEALHRFLVDFPAEHPLGNPHAAEAGRLTAEASVRIAEDARRQEEAERSRRAESEAAAAARRVEQERLAWAEGEAQTVRGLLQPVLRDRLADLLAEATDIGRGAVLLHLENRGVHQVSYGVVQYGPAPEYYGTRLLEPAAIAEPLGRKVYDEKARKVDADALRVFLLAAFVAPDERVLGVTARAIYPAFRRRVRNELLLYRGVTGQLGPIAELKAEFVKRTPGVPEASRDWREFYKSLFERTDSLRAFGIAPCELRDLDLGFWVRRVEDGTAPMLGDFLKKVLAAFDGDWLKAHGGKLEPFTATGGWVDTTEVKLTKKGAAWVFEENGEAVDPCTRGFRADPPEKSPSRFDDETTKDRLVRGVTSGVEGFTPDGKQLVVTGNDGVSWFDVESMKEVRSVPLAKGNASGAKLAGGRRLVVRPVQEGRTELLDAATGAVLAQFNGFVAEGFDPGAMTLARLSKKSGEQPPFIDVRFRTDGSEWRSTTIPLPPRQFEEVKVHPSGEVVYSRQLSATAPDKAGWKAWDIGSGERRRELDLPEVSHFAFSPAGNRLCRCDEAKGEVLVDWIDVAEGARAPVKGKRWPGMDCRWLSESRLLVNVRPQGQVSVLKVIDVASGATVGRPIRSPSGDIQGSFVDTSPDGRWLLLIRRDGSAKSLQFWSLEAATPAPSSRSDAGQAPAREGGDGP